MRVIHLYDGHEQVYRGRGSVPGVVWNVARGTAAAGHEVTVLERQWEGLPATAEHEGVAFHRLDLRTGADEPWTRVPYEEVTSPSGAVRLVADRTNFALAALRWLRGMEFDVLHVHLPFAANVLATVAPWLRDRMVYTAHLGELRLDLLEGGQEGDGDGPDVPSFLSVFSPDVFLANRVAQTTVLNPAIESAFVDRGVPPSSVRIIPNGVDIERFGTVDTAALKRVRETYGIGDRPVLLFVGTLMPRKGVTELVGAIDRVVNERDYDVDVVLAGEADLDVSYTQRVERLIARAGLDSHITMPGFVPGEDLTALYHLADALVVPSLEEGFGMTAIEAMAAGTPVVGTRVGGLPDLIDSERTGTLADPGDVSGLTDAIEDMLNLIVDSRTDIEDAARSKAAEYAWPSVAERFIEVYEEVHA
ncbi:glycosyltransferase family 4 protein [Halobellus limi]|uniref:(1->4)-alpha-D-glucan synthase (UDP-glucose) n=1 Tax=Halobellus limi TaxID=699433 RepID=A0A1H5TYZ1_9EURY|nr:glycosyltransferase family 4 protein [Halobellus limi]QCC47216.1 glycosyltransferase family 1 protein [Halobellus limi]SEF67227.1 (1->4)-alpha-D-glucan synthase (UDP-glucose) [Halobellus limi]